MICDICIIQKCTYILPDRSTDDGAPFHNVCLICLDSLLTIFPLNPNTFFTRQLTGKMDFKKKPRSTKQSKNQRQN